MTQPGQIPIQILVSLGLLICAVIAAIMFDLIKGKNEQLREMIIELKVRNDESARRERILRRREQPRMGVPPITSPAAAPTEINPPAPSEAAPPTAQGPDQRLPSQHVQILPAGAHATIDLGPSMDGNFKQAQPHSVVKNPEWRISVAENVEIIEIATAPPLALQLFPTAQSGQSSSFSPENLTPIERRAPYRGIKLEAIVIEFREQIATSSPRNWDGLISRRASTSTTHRGLLAAVFAATVTAENATRTQMEMAITSANAPGQDASRGPNNLVTMRSLEPEAVFALAKAV